MRPMKGMIRWTKHSAKPECGNSQITRRIFLDAQKHYSSLKYNRLLQNLIEDLQKTEEICKEWNGI